MDNKKRSGSALRWGAPDEKRYRSQDQDADSCKEERVHQEVGASTIMQCLDHYFNPVVVVPPAPPAANDAAAAAAPAAAAPLPVAAKDRYPPSAEYLPFWYSAEWESTKGFMVDGRLGKVWVARTYKNVSRPSTNEDACAILRGFDKKANKFLFQNPRGARLKALTTQFDLEYGVPTTHFTPVFPRLLPEGGEEHQRHAEALYADCMKLIVKAITGYCCPTAGYGKIYGAATEAPRARSDKSPTRTLNACYSHSIVIQLVPDSVTGKLALSCKPLRGVNPLPWDGDLFTPVVLANIILILQTYETLARIPRNLRMTCRLFAPHLGLADRLAVEKDPMIYYGPWHNNTRPPRTTPDEPRTYPTFQDVWNMPLF
jgi:hypothetical protein